MHHFFAKEQHVIPHFGFTFMTGYMFFVARKEACGRIAGFMPGSIQITHLFQPEPDKYTKSVHIVFIAELT
ncbi:hypothetical protein [Legionella spiritensis]|uniref:hypothetical protein n=1 Tax=Legionella spiritensis TaxID=452 RepID=UPI000F81FDE9|nr:hypothetical protein [Legionella spiritensis]